MGINFQFIDRLNFVLRVRNYQTMKTFILVLSVFYLSFESEALTAACEPLADSAATCQKLCRIHMNCGAWSWRKANKKCHLKTAFGWTAHQDKNYVSGLENGSLIDGYNYYGGGSNLPCWNLKTQVHNRYGLCTFKTKDANDCQVVCQNVSGCERWEWSQGWGCFLKKRYGWTPKYSAVTTSGFKYGSHEKYTHSNGADLNCNKIWP